MASSAAPPNPLPPDEDRGPKLMAMFWVWSGISMILVSLRFYTRIRIRGVGWDDWMMLASLILFLLTTCFVTYMASLGGSRHVWYLTNEQLALASKWSWISQPPAILLFATTKSSIAILILRLTSRTTTAWRRYTLWTIIALVCICNFLGVVFTFAQCSPARALWTPGMKAKCWAPTVQEHYNFFLGAINVTSDVVLAILPTTFIPRLNLQTRRKVGLCILLGLGIIAAIFGAIKVSYIAELAKRSDFTWGTYNAQAWSGAEGFILIFCGNMPPLQPLWEQLFARKPMVPGSGQTPLKDPRSEGSEFSDLGKSSYTYSMTSRSVTKSQETV